jgi:hypothetical protein
MAKKRWGDSYQKIVVRPSQFNCWSTKDSNFAKLQRLGQGNLADKTAWEESIKIIEEIHNAPEKDNPIPGVCNYFSGEADTKKNKWEKKNPFVLPDVPKFHFVKLD